MAKQVTILLVSLFLLIFCGVWEIKYLERTANYLYSDIEYVKNAVQNNNFEAAKKQEENVEQTWKDMKVVWNIFVNHERVDDVEETLVELKSYVESEDDKEAIKSADKLARIIGEIIEKQRLSFEHVL